MTMTKRQPVSNREGSLQPASLLPCAPACGGEACAGLIRTLGRRKRREGAWPRSLIPGQGGSPAQRMETPPAPPVPRLQDPSPAEGRAAQGTAGPEPRRRKEQEARKAGGPPIRPRIPAPSPGPGSLVQERSAGRQGKGCTEQPGEETPAPGHAAWRPFGGPCSVSPARTQRKKTVRRRRALLTGQLRRREELRLPLPPVQQVPW